MIPFRLARAAAEAEGIRLRLMARRTVRRIVFGCFALCLFFAALGFLHVAIWCWLAETLPARTVALIITGGDLVLGFLFVGAAALSGAGAAEREALAVRRRALEDVCASLTLSALVFQVFNLFARLRRRTE